MKLGKNNLDWLEDGDHSLLARPGPAYSNETVRRAFIVWLYCGQMNKFRDVCTYYHNLEAFEATLTPEQRFASRSKEVQLFMNRPRTTPYLDEHFPNLYPEFLPDPYYISKVEAIRNQRCVFKLEGFHEYEKTGVSRREIYDVSKMIRQYCQSKCMTLRRFLADYRQYAKRCNIKVTVRSIASYIKKKQVEAELTLVESMPTDFSFLHGTSGSGNEMVPDEKLQESEQLKLLLGVSPTNTKKSFDRPTRSYQRIPLDPIKSHVLQELSNRKVYPSYSSVLKNKVESTYDYKTYASASCAEFFKLFRNRSSVEEKCISYKDVPLTFDDFVKALNGNCVKSNYLDRTNINILTNKAFKHNRDFKQDSYLLRSTLIQVANVHY